MGIGRMTSEELLMTITDCTTGVQETRPYTKAELRAWNLAKAEEEANPAAVVVDPLEELRQQIAALQALVSSLTKGVQTTP